MIRHIKDAAATIDKAISTALQRKKPVYLEIPVNVVSRLVATPSPLSMIPPPQVSCVVTRWPCEQLLILFFKTSLRHPLAHPLTHPISSFYDTTLCGDPLTLQAERLYLTSLRHPLALSTLSALSHALLPTPLSPIPPRVYDSTPPPPHSPSFL